MFPGAEEITVPRRWSVRATALKQRTGLANLIAMLQKYVGALPQSEIATAAAGYLDRFSEQPERHPRTAASLARRVSRRPRLPKPLVYSLTYLRQPTHR